MTGPLKSWLLRSPKIHGGYLGALLLAFCRFTPSAIIQAHSPDFMPAQLVLCGIWAVPGLFWGRILGGGAGLAYKAWTEGQYQEARFHCRATSWPSFMIQAVWCAAFLKLVVLDMLTPADTQAAEAAMSIIGYLAVNVCLQAAGAMLLASYFLPKKPVQIADGLEV